MIFVSAEDKMTSLNALEAAGIPTVSIDRIPDGYDGPSVTFDNVKAGRMAAEYLLDLGHTGIAHISGPLKLRLARERLAGFQQAIEARGISSGLCVSGEGNWECMAGYKAMQIIMTSDRRPTALFAANDRMAIGAIQVIHEAGLRVPDDISVVGLDDIELAAFQNPPLTTVRQSFTELATMAVRILLDILGGKESERRQIVVEPSLVVRQSAAPLSQGKILTIS
jgi:LacI family transcriptional regulator